MVHTGLSIGMMVVQRVDHLDHLYLIVISVLLVNYLAVQEPVEKAMIYMVKYIVLLQRQI